MGMGSDKIYLVLSVNVLGVVSFHLFIKPLQVNSIVFVKPLRVNSVGGVGYKTLTGEFRIGTVNNSLLSTLFHTPTLVHLSHFSTL